MNELTLFVLLALLFAATASDLSSHRIPNLVSLGGIGAGLLINTFDSGLSGLLIGLGGVGIGFAVFVVPYAISIMGAGDVKLMMMAGAFVGWHHTLEAALITLMVGGVMGLGFIAVRGGLSSWIHRYSMMLCALAATKPSYIGPEKGDAACSPFPYAIAIALGTLITLFRTHAF